MPSDTKVKSNIDHTLDNKNHSIKHEESQIKINDDDLLNQILAMVKEIHGINTPIIDAISKFSEDIHQGGTIGNALVETALEYNTVTRAIKIMTWIGNYSSENNIANKLIEKSTQLLKAGNQMESDEAWRASLNLKILEAIAGSIGKIKELVTDRITQLGNVVEQMTPLVLSNHLLNTVYLLLKESNKLPLSSDDANKKLLAAAKCGDIAGIQNAVHFGANVNAKDKLELTPVDHAIQNNKIDATRLLIAKRSISQLQTGSVPGGPALHWVARQGSIEMLQCLIKAGLNPNERDANGLTPVDHAIQSNKIDATRLLIAKGVVTQSSC